MRGSIQMLRSEMDSDSSQTELMEIILRESDRLNRIITDFLSYARPRSLIQSRVDVGDLLHQTFALMRHSPEINSDQSIVEEWSKTLEYTEPNDDANTAIAQGVEQTALCILPIDAEGQIEGAACGDDAQIRVENQQRLPHRINDGLCKRAPVFDIIEWHHHTP